MNTGPGIGSALLVTVLIIGLAVLFGSPAAHTDPAPTTAPTTTLTCEVSK